MEFLNEKDLPYGFKYPESIKKAAVLGLINICPWCLMDGKWVKKFLPVLQQTYPKRKLIPFAVRQDNDDTACFEIGKGEQVQIIHVGASDGWEQCRIYSDFIEWLKAALDDMNSWGELIDCIESLKHRQLEDI